MNPFHGTPRRSPLPRLQPREPERPWTTSSSNYGAFHHMASRSPFRSPPSVLVIEPTILHGKHSTTAEEHGSFYESFRPLMRPRPPSDCTIQLWNRAIRDGKVSSEAIGTHTGIKPRRTMVGGFQPQPPTVAQRFNLRESEVIGVHPRIPLDATDAAQLRSEANFARRFPWHPQGNGAEAMAALGFQDAFRRGDKGSNASVGSP